MQIISFKKCSDAYNGIEVENAEVVISMTLLNPAFGRQRSLNVCLFVCLFNRADFRDSAGSFSLLCRASVDYRKEHPTREAERTCEQQWKAFNRGLPIRRPKTGKDLMNDARVNNWTERFDNETHTSTAVSRGAVSLRAGAHTG